MSTTPKKTETILTLPEVAAYLRVHPSTIYRMLKHRRIPAFNVGSDWRFNQSQIDQWIKNKEIKSCN